MNKNDVINVKSAIVGYMLCLLIYNYNEQINFVFALNMF